MKDIWVFLFCLGTVLFGWPIVSMFGHNLSLYLFAAWLMYIFVIYLATCSGKEKNNGG